MRRCEKYPFMMHDDDDDTFTVKVESAWLFLFGSCCLLEWSSAHEIIATALVGGSYFFVLATLLSNVSAWTIQGH